MAMVRVGYHVVVMWMVVVGIAIATSSQHAEAAIACNQVQGSMSQCLGYLMNGGKVPEPCCKGVRGLMIMAKTTPDRQTACKCLQSAAASIPGIKPGFASALPGVCRVKIPYKISRSTDCSKVK